jgi:hypothetical protein
MTLLWIFAAFVAFTLIIRSVHAVDDYALDRYGYAPFALPNVLFMLIPNGLLLFVVHEAGAGDHTRMLVTLAAAALLGMFVLIRSRANGWVAIFAAAMLLVCAPVLVFSVLFRSLSRSNSSES